MIVLLCFLILPIVGPAPRKSSEFFGADVETVVPSPNRLTQYKNPSYRRELFLADEGNEDEKLDNIARRSSEKSERQSDGSKQQKEKTQKKASGNQDDDCECQDDDVVCECEPELLASDLPAKDDIGISMKLRTEAQLRHVARQHALQMELQKQAQSHELRKSNRLDALERTRNRALHHHLAREAAAHERKRRRHEALKQQVEEAQNLQDEDHATRLENIQSKLRDHKEHNQDAWDSLRRVNRRRDDVFRRLKKRVRIRRKRDAEEFLNHASNFVSRLAERLDDLNRKREELASEIKQRRRARLRLKKQRTNAKRSHARHKAKLEELRQSHAEKAQDLEEKSDHHELLQRFADRHLTTEADPQRLQDYYRLRQSARWKTRFQQFSNKFKKLLGMRAQIRENIKAKRDKVQDMLDDAKKQIKQMENNAENRMRLRRNKIEDTEKKIIAKDAEMREAYMRVRRKYLKVRGKFSETMNRQEFMEEMKGRERSAERAMRKKFANVKSGWLKKMHHRWALRKKAALEKRQKLIESQKKKILELGGGLRKQLSNDAVELKSVRKKLAERLAAMKKKWGDQWQEKLKDKKHAVHQMRKQMKQIVERRKRLRKLRQKHRKRLVLLQKKQLANASRKRRHMRFLARKKRQQARRERREEHQNSRRKTTKRLLDIIKSQRANSRDDDIDKIMELKKRKLARHMSRSRGGESSSRTDKAIQKKLKALMEGLRDLKERTDSFANGGNSGELPDQLKNVRGGMDTRKLQAEIRRHKDKIKQHQAHSKHVKDKLSQILNQLGDLKKTSDEIAKRNKNDETEEKADKDDDTPDEDDDEDDTPITNKLQHHRARLRYHNYRVMQHRKHIERLRAQLTKARGNMEEARSDETDERRAQNKDDEYHEDDDNEWKDDQQPEDWKKAERDKREAERYESNEDDDDYNKNVDEGKNRRGDDYKDSDDSNRSERDEKDQDDEDDDNFVNLKVKHSGEFTNHERNKSTTKKQGEEHRRSEDGEYDEDRDMISDNNGEPSPDDYEDNVGSGKRKKIKRKSGIKPKEKKKKTTKKKHRTKYIPEMNVNPDADKNSRPKEGSSSEKGELKEESLGKNKKQEQKPKKTQPKTEPKSIDLSTEPNEVRAEYDDRGWPTEVAVGAEAPDLILRSPTIRMSTYFLGVAAFAVIVLPFLLLSYYVLVQCVLTTLCWSVSNYAKLFVKPLLEYEDL